MLLCGNYEIHNMKCAFCIYCTCSCIYSQPPTLLCTYRPFEVLVTSWLQTALHKDPLKRGVKTSASETAPCLSVMEHNLNSLVGNEDSASFSFHCFFFVNKYLWMSFFPLLSLSCFLIYNHHFSFDFDFWTGVGYLDTF